MGWGGTRENFSLSFLPRISIRGEVHGDPECCKIFISFRERILGDDSCIVDGVAGEEGSSVRNEGEV